MRQEVPEPWASAMVERGFVYANRPSLRALARAAGIPSSETVRALVHGLSSPSIETVDALADALGQPRVEVARWVGESRATTRPFTLPPEASLLTTEEQDAVRDLIVAIGKPRRASNDRAELDDSRLATVRKLRAAHRQRGKSLPERPKPNKDDDTD